MEYHIATHSGILFMMVLATIVFRTITVQAPHPPSTHPNYAPFSPTACMYDIEVTACVILSYVATYCFIYMHIICPCGKVKGL